MGARVHGKADGRLRRLACVLLASALLALSGCATPVRPSGGPPDTTPPALVAATPAEGATGVTADRLVLTFSERVDGTSAARAVTVAPAFPERPEVRVRGREVEVLFPDRLRPQTTYVVTLGRELQDLRGVGLAAPITLAFATGDRLDRGRLAGRVLDPATGRAAAAAVFAYRLADASAAPPDPRTTPPDYRTETGDDGRFRLDYLRPGPFYVVAVEDLNRSGFADPGERFAAPPRPAVEAVETDTVAAPALDLYVTARDTTAPSVRSARALTARVLAVRFGEPVRRPTTLTLADSARGAALAVEAVWVPPDAPDELRVLAARSLAAPVRLTAVVADSSGNAADVRVTIPPAAEPDTAAVRFASFLPPGGAADSVFLLRPDADPGVRFSRPLDSLALRERTLIVGSEGPLPYVAATDDGVSYRLLPTPRPRAFRVEVQGPDTLYVRRYARPGPDALGGILGRVDAPDGGAVLVEAYPATGPPYGAVAGPDGAFALRGLPPGEYRLRLVLDRNGDGAWDGGRLAPYAPPEPLRWLAEPVRVRARWDTELGPPAPVLGGAGG